MKRYLTGLLALGFAIIAFAFTKESKKIVNGKEVVTAGEPCAEVNKKWFLINLECNGQGSFSDLTNAGNYTLSNATEAGESCQGTECVCAIFACATANGTPMIPQNSSIYTALSNYWNFGVSSGLLKEKDQFWGRR